MEIEYFIEKAIEEKKFHHNDKNGKALIHFCPCFYSIITGDVFFRDDIPEHIYLTLGYGRGSNNCKVDSTMNEIWGNIDIPLDKANMKYLVKKYEEERESMEERFFTGYFPKDIGMMILDFTNCELEKCWQCKSKYCSNIHECEDDDDGGCDD